MSLLPFSDRNEAAHALSRALAPYATSHPVVLAIPRGAVPIGRIVAEALGGELDVMLVRKLGAPGNPEFAVGAVDETGTVLLNKASPWTFAGESYLRREVQRQQQVLVDRRARYGTEAIDLKGRTVIVVDDGLATGATMAAALRAARARRPARLICAVPVASHEGVDAVASLADEVVCLATPRPFGAGGLYYRPFPAVSDDEVMRDLRHWRQAGHATRRAVSVPDGRVTLDGELTMPPAPAGLVVFAHGSGSSRHSVRNRHVADVLNEHGIATLLFDLLTRDEDRAPSARFDITLLAQRLHAAVAWTEQDASCRDLPLGLFGASTGAAAALQVAAEPGVNVAAVVCRGGRVDMAGRERLAALRCPVLLIVGGDDQEVLALNRYARDVMDPWGTLEVVPGAGHLFEEPGTLDTMATRVATWLATHLQPRATVHALRSAHSTPARPAGP